MIFISLLFTVFLEAAFWLIRQGFKIDTSKLANKERNAWSFAGLLTKIRDLGQVVVLVVMMLAFLTFIIYAYRDDFMNNPIQFTQQFYVLLATFGVYILLRHPLKSILGSMGKKVRGNLSRYRLTSKGIEIDLNFKNLTNRSKKYKVNIGFDEIDEIRTFSFMEAQSFLKYEIGPNVELVARQTQDMFQYMKGESNRPGVYTISALSSIGKTVFMRGPQLFYFLTFDTEDVGELINAFNSFRGSNQR